MPGHLEAELGDVDMWLDVSHCCNEGRKAILSFRLLVCLVASRISTLRRMQFVGLEPMLPAKVCAGFQGGCDGAGGEGHP